MLNSQPNDSTPCPSCTGLSFGEYPTASYGEHRCDEKCVTCAGSGLAPTCSTCGSLLTGDDLTEGAEECFSCWGAKQADECEAERAFATEAA